METKVSSATKEVIIDINRPTVLIGERINPTGRKKLTEALKTGDLDMVRREALEQVAAGADIIDVNVNAAGVEDVKLLPEAVKVVMEAVDAPICLDRARTTIKNLRIIDVRPDLNIIALKGAVPGGRNSLITITKV